MAPPEAPAKPATPQDQLHKLLSNPKIMIGAGAAILLLVGFAAFTLARRKKRVAASIQTTAKLAAPAVADEAKADKQITAAQDSKLRVAGNSQKALETPDITAQVETLRQNVRESVTRDPALAAGVIRTWIAEAET